MFDDILPKKEIVKKDILTKKDCETLGDCTSIVKCDGCPFGEHDFQPWGLTTGSGGAPWTPINLDYYET